MVNQRLTLSSKMKDIYKHPIGHDIIFKIIRQLGRSEYWITNPIVGNLTLGTMGKLLKGMLGEGFADTFLKLLNAAEITDHAEPSEITRAWWKEAIVYQIYPRSFKDANGDGIGDLAGILEKLDYLQELGIDTIWLSPIYDSPNDDNGYDIRDYYQIMAEFGTMADFDRLLEQAHQRGMKLIMDLVVNHTSDEHEWFQHALHEPDSPYKDYYLWKKSVDAKPPTNWTSFFSGSAWNYYEQHDEWALHLFSKKQMDLNWDNERMRADIYRMINWWLDKGVDGFRLDVINYISKDPALPEGNPSIGQMMGYYGIEHYFHGPRLHAYLQEMRRETFDRYGAVTVGETPGVGIEISKLLTAESRKELDMVFSFDHLETPGKVRFDDYRYDLNAMKAYYTDWMLHYGKYCWMTLFYDNHDNPRMLSKVNPDPQYRAMLGKLLAMLQLTLKGTPFIYQGQELGMINVEWHDISEFRDVESINLYMELLPQVGKEAALRKVISGSRDHARTPMQWSAADNGGFTTGTPWIKVSEDYKQCNAQTAIHDEDSIWHFYKRLIALRKSDETLIYGDFQPAANKRRDVFAYYRQLGSQRYYVELNLTAHVQRRPMSVRGYERVMGNYDAPADSLRAYEATLYRG